MGGTLGTLFARAAGGKARAGALEEAVQGADALLLAVHWCRIDDVLNQVGDFSGKVVVSCLPPLNVQNTEHILGHTTSGAEAFAKEVPDAEVVSAFNNIPSEVLFGVFEARGSAAPPSMADGGDNQTAKSLAATLVRDVGFGPVDAGPLRIARYTEPFALLVSWLAYRAEGGPELGYWFERFRPEA